MFSLKKKNGAKHTLLRRGDPTGNRTRVSAVRGLRLDRLTMGPSFQIALIIVVDSLCFVNKKRTKIPLYIDKAVF